MSPVYSCEPRAAPAATIRRSAPTPTESASAYSRSFGPGRGTPMTRATSAGVRGRERLERRAGEVELGGGRVEPVGAVGDGPGEPRPRDRPGLLERAGDAQRGGAQAAVDVLALGRHLERQAVEGELREHGLLLVEPAAVEREALAVAVGRLEHPRERRQVDGAADDLDRRLRRRDPERVHADERRLVRREHVEQAGRKQPWVPVVGHRADRNPRRRARDLAGDLVHRLGQRRSRPRPGCGAGRPR